jgi:hypothetical protein
MRPLGALEVSLASEHLGGAARDAGGVDLGRVGVRDASGGRLHLLLAAAMAQHGAGERLLGGVFMTLAKSTHPLESEAERGSGHGRVLGRPRPPLSVPGRLS